MGKNGRAMHALPSGNGDTPPPLLRDSGLMPVAVIPTPTSWYWGQAEVQGEIKVVLTAYTPSGVQTYFMTPAGARTMGVALQQLGSAGNVMLGQAMPPEPLG